MYWVITRPAILVGNCPYLQIVYNLAGTPNIIYKKRHTKNFLNDSNKRQKMEIVWGHKGWEHFLIRRMINMVHGERTLVHNQNLSFISDSLSCSTAPIADFFHSLHIFKFPATFCFNLFILWGDWRLYIMHQSLSFHLKFYLYTSLWSPRKVYFSSVNSWPLIFFKVYFE